jgi:hypothetical protein
VNNSSEHHNHYKSKQSKINMQTNINVPQELNNNGLYGQVWDGTNAEYHFGDKVVAEVEVKVKNTLIKKTMPGTILGARISESEGRYLTRKCKNENYAILFEDGHLNSEVPMSNITGLVQKTAQNA